MFISHDEPVQKDIPVELPLTDHRMMELQEQDPLIGRLRKEWKANNLDQNHFTMERDILRKKKIINGMLYKPMLVPDILKDCLLMLAHNEQGHNGFRRTYNALRYMYHWKGMKPAIQKHCTRCITCAKHNISVQQLQKEHFKVPPQPMEFIAMDLIGEFHPASSKGNRYALTAVCMLTGVVLFTDPPVLTWHRPTYNILSGRPPLTLGAEVQLCWLLPLTLEPSA